VKEWREHPRQQVPDLDAAAVLLGEGTAVDEAGSPIVDVPEGTPAIPLGQSDLVENETVDADDIPSGIEAVNRCFRRTVEGQE